MRTLINFIRVGLLFLIKFYKFFISPLFPDVCRYYPSCSTYAAEALQRYGLLKGGLMSIKRVLTCNPFYPGGYDPLK